MLLTLLAVQQPQIAIAVDRDTVRAGEEIIVTITVQAPGDQPIELVDPELRNLELRNTSNQSRFMARGVVGLRTTTRSLTVRALAEGTATIGAVIARQGTVAVSTDPVTIVVEGALPAGVRELEPRIARMLAAREPAIPSPEEVSLAVFAVPERVTVGEQVDVIIAAWVPRDIRTRLRNPPTLESPQVRGAWAYRQPTPPGIAMSREVGGIMYDVFVQHEAIFPLTAGTASVGVAKVSYSLPLSYSFLSRELRHEVQSEPVEIGVSPMPPPPPDLTFGGATGVELAFDLEASASELAFGDAVTVRATIHGSGNVALWPEPEFDWPAGLRAYSRGVDVRLEPGTDDIGGSKVFNYLIIADSIGVHQVEVSPYVYFDVGERQYRALSVGDLEFTTPSTRAAALSRGQGLPPLIEPSGLPSAAVLVNHMPVWAVLLVVLVPPFLAVATRWRASGWRTPRSPRKREASSPHEWDIAFRRTLESLVPHAAERSGEELAEALRASGIDAPLAAHAARMRDRLSRAVYGPDDLADAQELLEEIREVVAALTAEDDPAGRRGLVVAVIVLAMLPLSLDAQTPEALYRAGATRVAAESLSARTAQAPLVAEHWYNLGNALAAMGEPVRARVAWLRAARLAPRHSTVRLPVRDATTVRLGPQPARVWVSPITAAEFFVLGVVFWIAGWALVTLRLRRILWAPVLATSLLCAVLGTAIADRYERSIGLVLTSNTGLREAPYGPAQVTIRLDPGTPVQIEGETAGWMLVRIGRDRGWMRRVDVVRI